MATLSSTPLCPCCQQVFLTDLRSDTELGRWGDLEGVSWRRSSGGTPRWDLCLACHRQEWPNDRRCNNRHSSPSPFWMRLRVGRVRGASVSRLDAGDFFLTAAPPELVGESGVPLGTARRAKRRKARSRQELLALYTNSSRSHQSQPLPRSPTRGPAPALRATAPATSHLMMRSGAGTLIITIENRDIVKWESFS